MPKKNKHGPELNPPRERLDKMLKTNEQWYGTYEGGMYRLSFIELPTYQGKRPPTWRVCAWGNDDFGMERDFSNRKDALDTFNDIHDYTTKEELRILYEFGPA